MNKKTETTGNKVVSASTVVEKYTIRESIRDHVTALKLELTRLQSEEIKCINERAHEKQFYAGRVVEVGKEIEYLEGVLIDN